MGKALLLSKTAIWWKKAATSPISKSASRKKRAVKFPFLFSLPQIFCKVLKALMLLQWIS